MNFQLVGRLYIAFCLLLWGSAHAASPRQSGIEQDDRAGMFSMPEQTGVTGVALQVYYYKSSGWKPGSPVLVVLHGVNRDADRYRDEWRQLGEQHDLLVVCPEFSSAKYPGDRYYNMGNVIDGDDIGAKAQLESHRVYPAIDRVFDEIRSRFGAIRATYSLYGHSAGAQFAHRFLLFAQATKADLIVPANAGWYTMPDRNVDFPYGLKGLPTTDKELAAALGQRAMILLGDQDIDSSDKNLRRTPQANAQGAHRFARGKAFYDTAKAKAAELGVPFHWTLVTVPGVAHSNAGMARMAAKLIAGEKIAD